MTLFVPENRRGFVDPVNGQMTLRRILVPVDHKPGPRAAVELATRAASMVPGGEVEITVMHVGERDHAPELRLPDDPRLRFTRVTREGKVVDEILAAAGEGEADLIVMVTEGREGILDALRGSTTEQVVRKAPCPLLAVPTAWLQEVAG